MSYYSFSFIEEVLLLDSTRRYASHEWETLYPADSQVVIERCKTCGYTKVTASDDIPYCKEYLMDEALK